nr:DHHW family protein [Tissierella sp.]
MKNQIKDKILVVLFGALLLGLSVFNLLTPERGFSQRENRFLEKQPEFSLESLIKGEFSEKFQKYTSDQFISRDRWISLKTRMDLAILKQDNGRVYFGEDDFLFDLEAPLDGARFIKNMKKINSFKKETDLPLDLMLVPTKTTVYGDKLPARAPTIDEKELLKDIEAKLDSSINLVDLIEVLTSKNSQKLYYKTDHHYTSLGAYYSYAQYMDHLDLKPYSLDYFKREVVSDEFLGSQFRKSSYYRGKSEEIERFIPREDTVKEIIKNQEEKSSSLYDEKFLKKSDKYSFFLGGDDAVVDITTSAEEGGTLLVVKDSFANSMIPFLSLHFSRIIVIDERYFNIPLKDYIEDLEIDRVLFLKNIRTFYDG